MDREIMQTNKMDPEKFRPDEAKALDTKKIMDEILNVIPFNSRGGRFVYKLPQWLNIADGEYDAVMELHNPEHMSSHGVLVKDKTVEGENILAVTADLLAMTGYHGRFLERFEFVPEANTFVIFVGS